MSHNLVMALFAGVWLAFPGVLCSQESRARSATGSQGQETRKSQETLDSQLLEGLGSSGSSSAVTVPGKVDTPPGRDALRAGGGLEPRGEGSDLGQENPLMRIGRQMLRVEGKLVQRDVSPETRQTQQQIVRDLDAVIEALAAAQKNEKQRKPGSSNKGNQKPSKAGKQAARNGSGKPGEGDSDQQLAAMQGEEGEFWGHLPQRLRRQMQSAGAIEFLPKYRKLIEDYYKRLAEDRGIQQ